MSSYLESKFLDNSRSTEAFACAKKFNYLMSPFLEAKPLKNSSRLKLLLAQRNLPFFKTKLYFVFAKISI